MESGYQNTLALLEQGISFTAVCAQNDRMAIGAMHALRQAGFTVPQDISVIGFDDIPLAAFQEPPLTTVRQDAFEIGQLAARLLIERVEQPERPVQHVLLPAELVVRDWTANCRQPTADRLPQTDDRRRTTVDC